MRVWRPMGSVVSIVVGAQISILGCSKPPAADPRAAINEEAGGTIVRAALNTPAVAPSGLSYSTPDANYAKTVPIEPNIPTLQAGAPLTFQIAPALPVGLQLNSLTGVISGTPSSSNALDSSTRTVTAWNSAGSVSTTLHITITAAPAFPPLTVFRYGLNPAVCAVGLTCRITPIQDAPIAAVTLTEGPLPAGVSLDTVDPGIGFKCFPG